MIKAKEACAIACESQKKAIARCHEFMNEVCEPAIVKAASIGQYETFVEVSAYLQDEAATTTLTDLLCREGYVAQMRYGSKPAILIRWNVVK